MSTDVISYESEINGIQFTVIDTPGLCDEVEQVGNDQKYLELMRSKAKQVDLVWFVTPLNETRIRSDELNGIKYISEAFSSNVWKHSIIVFTCADLVNASKYTDKLDKRTKLIREAIEKKIEAIEESAAKQIVDNIPSVAVTNISETTPDGKKWLGELYTKVFVKVSGRGTLPFLLATVQRINSTSSREPNQKHNSTQEKHTEPQSNTEDKQYDYKKQKVNFDDEQKEEVKEKLFDVVPIIKKVGKAIGSVFGAAGGKIGEEVGGVVGHAINFIFSLF